MKNVENQENLEHMLKKRCMSKIQKMFRYLLLDLDMTKYISNILCPIWRYTHKAFPPTPPHPTPMLGPSAEGPGGGMGWGGGVGGESLMGIFPYWI